MHIHWLRIRMALQNRLLHTKPSFRYFNFRSRVKSFYTDVWGIFLPSASSMMSYCRRGIFKKTTSSSSLTFEDRIQASLQELQNWGVHVCLLRRKLSLEWAGDSLRYSDAQTPWRWDQDVQALSGMHRMHPLALPTQWQAWGIQRPCLFAFRIV